MDAIQSVKPKDSQTLMLDFNLKMGATQYIIRVQSANGFYREDTVSSSPAEIKSLTPYTEYTLSTLAVNSGGRSQPSPPVTEKTGTVVWHSMCAQDVRFLLKCFHFHSYTQCLLHAWKWVTLSLWNTEYFSHHSSCPAEVTRSASLSIQSNPGSVFIQIQVFPCRRNASAPLRASSVSVVTVPDPSI